MSPAVILCLSRPVFSQRPDGIFENEKPSTLLGGYRERQCSLPPLPAGQFRLSHPDAAFAQPGSGGDAVRTTEDLEAHCVNAITADTRRQLELRPIGAPASGTLDDSGAGLEASAVAWMIEVIDHQGGVAGMRDVPHSSLAGGGLLAPGSQITEPAHFTSDDRDRAFDLLGRSLSTQAEAQ